MNIAIAFAIAALVVVATIGGILSGFLIHQYVLPKMSASAADALGGVIGIILCTLIVFALMWQLNPDPPGGAGNLPSVGSTAVLTAFSALLWVPLFLVTYAAIRKYRVNQ